MAANNSTAVSVPISIGASKTKTKKKHFVAQKVKLFRASEPLFSVLMWGIDHSINELTHVPIPVMLLPDDFKAFTKIKVDNHLYNNPKSGVGNCTYLRENMPSHFKFKEYCPLVFRNLRERFDIDDQDFQRSLTKLPPQELDKAILSATACSQNSVIRSAPVCIDAQGRSSARFLTTYDRKFVIKTIVSEDVAEMHNILKKYHQFIVECHGNTLLPQFLGMYRLTVDGVETYMVVTRNVFSQRLIVHRKYDLKGSTVAREASEKEKAKELPTFKDNDFINEKQRIVIGEENKKLFLEKLKRDVEFLAQLKIMDYSLLVGIHDVERADQDDDDVEEGEEGGEGGEEGEAGAEWAGGDDETGSDANGSGGPVGAVGSYGTTPPDCSGFSVAAYKPMGPGEFDPNTDVYALKAHESAPRKEVYFMAIIDILTHYDAKKKAAHAAKTVKHGAGAEISTVNPEQYSKRFLDFMASILE
ncbi:phosphatidylinositol 5-phosphate 4-kinase type-2 alpha isoform X1 [Petromyzon marinus]|uniref:1-phosphatidylinositol-5-phosphate 4-kinase n=1 Tax=Petromyzon marinus TaxID=7757 RepID=A0AAJ7TAC8_PETMA|nr:phosphatidylinositol 5-phosphate 4-kinase type-2 alpha isoform X1 [Petromyzon marinus]